MPSNKRLKVVKISASVRFEDRCRVVAVCADLMNVPLTELQVHGLRDDDEGAVFGHGDLANRFLTITFAEQP